MNAYREDPIMRAYDRGVADARKCCDRVLEDAARRHAQESVMSLWKERLTWFCIGAGLAMVVTALAFLH